MCPENGEFNNLATRVAICKELMSEESGNEAFVDQLLNKKDRVDKQDVMYHMDDFSCKEEMERFVENYEENYAEKPSQNNR